MKLFHSKASHRRRKNVITGVKDDQGVWKEWENKDKVVMDYFKVLFTSSKTERDTEVLDGTSGKIIVEMNKELTKEFTKDKIKVALYQMNSTKAPWPDGMAPLFFQKY